MENWRTQQTTRCCLARRRQVFARSPREEDQSSHTQHEIFLASHFIHCKENYFQESGRYMLFQNNATDISCDSHAHMGKHAHTHTTQTHRRTPIILLPRRKKWKVKFSYIYGQNVSERGETTYKLKGIRQACISLVLSATPETKLVVVSWNLHRYKVPHFQLFVHRGR